MDSTSETVVRESSRKDGESRSRVEAVPQEAVAKKGGNGKARNIVLVVLLVGAVAAFVHWLSARHLEETDDAQSDADISNVGAKVTGTVIAVHVVENQSVKAGDVLLDLDTSTLDIALAQAKAEAEQADAQLKAEDPSVAITQTSNTASVASASSDVASAGANLSAAVQQVSQIAAQLEQARATDRQAQLDKQRDDELMKANAISPAENDRAVNAAEASAAGVRALEQAMAAARDRVAQARAQVSAASTHLSEVKSNSPMQLDTRRATVLVRQASLDLALAGVRQAELNLSYAHVLSPVDGIVGKKGVAVGDHVTPGQQLFAIVQTTHPWVTANFRETQLDDMREGQPATIHVDALSLDLRGKVGSIGGATGARLSILPPENATGNFVKVVQRIPVRIEFDPNQNGLDRLRPGMSVEPEVSVR